MEIERKFKVKRLPSELSGFDYCQIEQGYLSTAPIIRIRQKDDNYILTYKSKATDNNKSISICDEVELPLTRESYFHLRNKTDNNLITKKRFLIPLENNLTAELDIFEGNLMGLYFVEVEFPSEKEAEEFNPPDWFGEDVSSNEAYSNYYLSTINNIDEL